MGQRQGGVYTCEDRCQNGRGNSASKERLQLGKEGVLSLVICPNSLVLDSVVSKKHLSHIESCIIPSFIY